MTLRMENLSTISEKPARLDLTGRLGPGAELRLHGTVGALGGPLAVALAGELREFAIPRANPYMLQQAGWKTIELSDSTVVDVNRAIPTSDTPRNPLNITKASICLISC